MEKGIFCLIISVGRASECGIWRSEVWFLMGTQNFFFVPCLWLDKNTFSISLPSWKLTISHYFIKMVLLTSLILAVCRMHVITIWTLGWALLITSVLECWSTESEGLMFYSSWGLRILFFVPHSWQDKKHLSLFYLLAVQKSQVHLLCNILRKSTCNLFFIHFFLSFSFFFFNLYFFQASVIHQDFLRFIHVDDHDLIRKNLLPFPEDEEEQVCFVVFSIFFLAMSLKFLL